METKHHLGHRERLKTQFIANSEQAHTDAALLELLLTYAIPQKDVQPLAQHLLTHFGSLSGVLSADITALCQQEGIKEHTAVLLKLADWLRQHLPTETMPISPPAQEQEMYTPSLFPDEIPDQVSPAQTTLLTPEHSSPTSLPHSGLFSNAVLKEAISVLPQIPDTDSLPEIRAFLRLHLPFSGQETRERYSQYIVQRMFPQGYADASLRIFARLYSGQQSLQDACFYRFCLAETLMYDIIEQLLLPAIGIGYVERSLIRDYLVQRFPARTSAKDSARAVISALTAGGLVVADKKLLHFSYREPSIAAFAFVLHSEFPQPGMFHLSEVEHNQAMRTLLWRPSSFVPMLYELRNRGIISKVSEIDSLRQMTIRYPFDQIGIVLQKQQGSVHG
jgi:hypothetical protein